MTTREFNKPFEQNMFNELATDLADKVCEHLISELKDVKQVYDDRMMVSMIGLAGLSRVLMTYASSVASSFDLPEDKVDALITRLKGYMTEIATDTFDTLVRERP